MRSYRDKVRRLSDHRLLNALRYQHIHSFPPEYVEACREELLQRGYTMEEIARELERFHHPDRDVPLTRLEYYRRRQHLVRWRWIWLGTLTFLIAVLLHAQQTAAPYASLLALIALMVLVLLLWVQFQLNALEKAVASSDDRSKDGEQGSP